MSRVLVHSANIPAAVPCLRHGQHEGPKRSIFSFARMITCLPTPGGLAMSEYSGLQRTNRLDDLLRDGQSFDSKFKRSVPRAFFERFTETAFNVIMLAQEEARLLGHNYVGTEQILLGILGEETGIASKVFKSMGINLEDARVEVEKIIGRKGWQFSMEIPFTPRAKRVLEQSLKEAHQLGHNYIGSEHLLLRLLREDEGVAAVVLKNLGADPIEIRTQVIRMDVLESTGKNDHHDQLMIQDSSKADHPLSMPW